MEKKKVILIFMLFMVLGSYYLEASVFRTFELSSKAATLGGAFVARADDASAIFYNPAGLAFSKGLRLKTDIYYFEMTSTAEYPDSLEQFKSISDQIYGSYFISVNIKDRIGIGIGGFRPNSMETKWPENWMGRTLSIHSKLNTLYIRPVISIKISKYIAAGAGLDFIFSNVTWNYNRIFTFQETAPGYIFSAMSYSNVSGRGVGLVTGILLRIRDNLRIGGKYQPKVKLNLEGSHNFHYPESGNPPFFINREVETTLSMPQEFILGLMYSPGKNLTFHLDLQWTGMSEIKQWEFEINPQFYDDFEDYYGMRPDFVRQGVDLDLRNTSRIMFGVEYLLKNSLALRIGYASQKSPVNNQMIHPVFPDLETNILSFGIGYDGPAFSIWRTDEKVGGFAIDVYFQYAFSQNIKSVLPEFPATYKSSHWVAGLGIGFNFGSF